MPVRFLHSGDNWVAVGAAHLCTTAGRVWFEVEVVEARGNAMVGVAGTNFIGNTTVGTDSTSWGVYSTGWSFHGRHTAAHSSFPLITPLFPTVLACFRPPHN